ncbi:inner membrane protein [Klebsiella michiganensis]|uniref:Inner membrane protein n=1 Tax=Klebsiella michiganensis TaxID=1134687 RepID=A0A7H4MVV8_9ENTR|nr:inner membrane protein [Klebsiella michiganensis]
MGIGIPASIESVLFNGGKLLTQMFVAGMGTNVIAGNFIAFSVAALINLPGNALGSASTIITGRRLGKGQIAQAERQAWHVFWLSTIILTAIAWGTAPLAGLIASFYTSEEDVKVVVKELLWLNAFFMPIWAMAWTLPCAFKGARDVRYTMWVSMLGMWGCRVVAGYTLGIVLGMGVIGVWLGMVLDWAVRGVCFTAGWSAGAGCGSIRERKRRPTRPARRLKKRNMRWAKRDFSPKVENYSANGLKCENSL